MTRLDLGKMASGPRDFLKMAVFQTLGNPNNKEILDSVCSPAATECTASLIINGQPLDLIPFFHHLEVCWKQAVTDAAQEMLQDKFAEIDRAAEHFLESLKDANPCM